MKAIILTLITALTTPAFATDFFQAGQQFIDTKRHAEGYIEDVTGDGQLHVMFIQGGGSYNSYRTIISPEAVAKMAGCSNQGWGCIGDQLLIKVTEKDAMVLPISGIMENGEITIGRQIVKADHIADVRKGQCLQTAPQKICIGDKVVTPEDLKIRQVIGLFNDDELAVYDKTIYSNNVRSDYFKIIKVENLK